MTITFKSIYGQSDNIQEIKFVATLEKFMDNGMHVLEFLEPSNNIQNRIEYNDEKVIIYAGPTTIHLEKNKKIKNDFVTEHGKIIIVSFLENVILNGNEISFEYHLSDHEGNLINNFKIELIISK